MTGRGRGRGYHQVAAVIDTTDFQLTKIHYCLWVESGKDFRSARAADDMLLLPLAGGLGEREMGVAVDMMRACSGAFQVDQRDWTCPEAVLW